MDVSGAVRKALKNNKTGFGFRSTINSLMTGKCHAVVLAGNCPRRQASDLERHAELAGVPAVRFEGTSLELGELCGRPFMVSALAILDPTAASELSRQKK
ncbi:50S ribosomal protein L30e [Candidatus Micrarchaeota archaeon]|nr:50S ribosomal protein L30e [Candidatus Micrarchaeota archaeon]